VSEQRCQIFFDISTFGKSLAGGSYRPVDFEVPAAIRDRWARRIKPATLQMLMRHRSIETTMKYYVNLSADDVADELWQNYVPTPTQFDAPFR
jgi:hypothetical protein